MSEYSSNLSHPQTVEVAVGIDRHRLVVIGKGKGDRGSGTGSQNLALTAGNGLQKESTSISSK